jgi:hypothetical protein
MNTKIVGLYKEFYGSNNNYPSILNNLSISPSEFKYILLDYLSTGESIAKAPAVLVDHVTGVKLENIELEMLTDGEWQWRSDLFYYVEKYNLRIDEEFLTHILAKVNKD